jgi:hypothetical protein
MANLQMATNPWRRKGNQVTSATPIAPSELRAIAFALDELEAYVGTVGREDDAYERHLWTIRKLREVLARFGEESP